MSDDPREPRGSDPKVAPFLAPDGVFGIPLRTLSDEIPAGDPRPRTVNRPSRLRRFLDRLRREER